MAFQLRDVITLPVTHMLVKRVHAESMALIVHVHMTRAILKSDMSTFSFSFKVAFTDYLPKEEGNSRRFGNIEVAVKQTTEKADHILTVLTIAENKVNSF